MIGSIGYQHIKTRKTKIKIHPGIDSIVKNIKLSSIYFKNVFISLKIYLIYFFFFLVWKGKKLSYSNEFFFEQMKKAIIQYYIMKQSRYNNNCIASSMFGYKKSSYFIIYVFFCYFLFINKKCRSHKVNQYEIFYLFMVFENNLGCSII